LVGESRRVGRKVLCKLIGGGEVEGTVVRVGDRPGREGVVDYWVLGCVRLTDDLNKNEGQAYGVKPQHRDSNPRRLSPAILLSFQEVIKVEL
jgi:hypothetical protein